MGIRRYLPLRTASLLVLLASVSLLLGCDPGEGFSYQNDTEELLYVEVNGGSDNPIPPGQSRTIAHLRDQIGSGNDPLHFIVTDERGCIVFSIDTTLQDFREEQGLRFTIVPSDLLPLEERTECVPIMRFKNSTDESLFVQLNEAKPEPLPPHTTQELSYPRVTRPPETEDNPLRIVIRDERGCVIVRQDTTLERFREEQLQRLHIQAEDLPPLEERKECDPSLAD